MGFVIAFEGLDGCGKTTTVSAVKLELENLGKTVKCFKFPNKDTEFGKRIYDILLRREEFDIVSQKFELAKLFIRDRKLAQHELKKAVKEYDFVLIDRYILTNAVYTASIEKNMTDEDRMTIVLALIKAESKEKLNHVTPHINLLLNITINHLIAVLNDRKEKDKYETVPFLCRCDNLYKNIIKSQHIIPYINIKDRVEIIIGILLDLTTEKFKC